MTLPKITSILQHFQEVDPIIYAELNAMNLKPLVSLAPQKYFSKICYDIMGQQLSAKASDAIFNRFVALCPTPISPQTVLTLTDQQLRNCGMSWAKARSVLDLSQKVAAGVVHLEHLAQLSDSQVITELIKVKGIGQWTAEMFLIFTLGRDDVFSAGDLGLKKGFAKLYGSQDIVSVTSLWSPFKSYGSLALWHVLDNK